MDNVVLFPKKKKKTSINKPLSSKMNFLESINYNNSHSQINSIILFSERDRKKFFDYSRTGKR